MRLPDSDKFLANGELAACPPAAPACGQTPTGERGCPRAPALLFLLLSLMLWRVEGILLASWLPGCPPQSRPPNLPANRCDQQRLSRHLTLAWLPPGARPARGRLSPTSGPLAVAPAPAARDLLYLLMSLQC